MIFLLLTIPAHAGSFDDFEIKSKYTITEFKPAMYKAKKFFAVTSHEYKHMNTQKVDELIAQRANQLCKFFGYDGADAYKVYEYSPIDAYEAYSINNRGIMLQKHECSWSAWTVATAILGVPIVYSHRIFESVACYK
jgi:hypothetical protein